MKQVWAIISGAVDLRDGMLAAGLVMLSIGAGEAWAPAGWIVPGMILTGVAVFGVRR